MKVWIQPEVKEYAEAEAHVRKWAQKVGQPAYLMSQSFPECRFVAYDGQIPNFAATFAGRIFGPEAEVRWVREGERARVWLTQESETEGTACIQTVERFYLWGDWNKDENQEEYRFREPRIPDHQKLTYPLSDELNINLHDRAYIEVYQYTPVAPESWPNDAMKVMDLLNQPRLLAHRFVRLAVGCGAHESGKETARV